MTWGHEFVSWQPVHYVQRRPLSRSASESSQDLLEARPLLQFSKHPVTRCFPQAQKFSSSLSVQFCTDAETSITVGGDAEWFGENVSMYRGSAASSFQFQAIQEEWLNHWR
jgi:hypothetical protein